MAVSLLYVLACRLFELVVLLGRGERSKELEILLLRHELSILRRQADRPRFEPRDRLLLAAPGCRLGLRARAPVRCGARLSALGRLEVAGKAACTPRKGVSQADSG